MPEPSGAAKRSRRRIPESFWLRAVYAFFLLVAVVIGGTLAMHLIEGWSYLDSFYFTSFIATGQGPPANLPVNDALGKIVSSLLAFISVGTVISALLFLFGPFLGAVFKEGEEKIEDLRRDLEKKERA